MLLLLSKWRTGELSLQFCSELVLNLFGEVLVAHKPPIAKTLPWLGESDQAESQLHISAVIPVGHLTVVTAGPPMRYRSSKIPRQQELVAIPLLAALGRLATLAPSHTGHRRILGGRAAGGNWDLLCVQCTYTRAVTGDHVYGSLTGGGARCYRASHWKDSGC